MSTVLQLHRGHNPLQTSTLHRPLEVAPEFDLGAWRKQRLTAMKARPEYQGLAPIQKKIVDYLAMRRESPDEGITEGQKKLAKKYDVCYQTMSEYLCGIVEAGVLTREFRPRRGFGGAGRTTNRYRLNEALLLPSQATEDRIGHRVDRRVDHRSANALLEPSQASEPELVSELVSEDRTSTSVLEAKLSLKREQAKSMPADRRSEAYDVKDEVGERENPVPVDPSSTIASIHVQAEGCSGTPEALSRIEAEAGVPIQGTSRQLVLDALADNEAGVLACWEDARNRSTTPLRLLIVKLKAGEHLAVPARCDVCQTDRPDARSRDNQILGRGAAPICDDCTRSAIQQREEARAREAERAREDELRRTLGTPCRACHQRSHDLRDQAGRPGPSGHCPTCHAIHVPSW